MADDVIVRLGAIDNGLTSVFAKAGQAAVSYTHLRAHET